MAAPDDGESSRVEARSIPSDDEDRRPGAPGASPRRSAPRPAGLRMARLMERADMLGKGIPIPQRRGMPEEGQAPAREAGAWERPRRHVREEGVGLVLPAALLQERRQHDAVEERSRGQPV